MTRAVTAAVVLLLAPAAHAMTPTETLQLFFAKANVVLQAPEAWATSEERAATVCALAADVFDAREAAESVLGDEWARRTPREQDEFAHVFGEVLQRGFLATVGARARLSDGLDVRYLGETVTGGEAIVRTTLATRDEDALAIDYRMVRRDERWLVRDATIDGEGLVGSYRAQFARVLGAYPFAELVALMRATGPDIRRGLAAPAQPGLRADADHVAAPLLEERPAPAVAVSAEPPAPEVSPARTATMAPTPAVERPATPVHLASARGVKDQRPAPGVGKGGSYWVQVGAFRNADAATRLIGRLRDPAIAVFTTTAGRSGEPLTRVLVGPYAARPSAVAKARELKAAGHAPFVTEERH